MSARTKNPWGRNLAESTPTTPWGRPAEPRQTTIVEPHVKDFVAAGLSLTEAENALAGLKTGRFISYEDACLSIARKHADGGFLKEDAMRERAKRFIDGRNRNGDL